MEFSLNNSNRTGGQDRQGTGKRTSGKEGEPGWAEGLRKLYDSVVDEPLPDSFDDLLRKLDDDDDDG
jgi:hypothetical protein